MKAFIMSRNQFNNLKNNPITVTYWAHGSGSSGDISVNIQNGDYYYGVIINDTIAVLSNTPIMLYKATLTAQ